MLLPFDFEPCTRIVYGAGRLDRLGELAREFTPRRALVVSDPGVVQAGHTQRGIQALERCGIESVLYSDVHENPTTDDVEAALAFARTCQPELLVGLGGGSSLDCAKGVNFLLTNGGRMQDYWGVGKATRPMLPMIAVPTTAGTGSEMQSFALISDARTKVKMACGDKKAACRVALLDPELTVTQPPRVTALTGIDAIAHALETFVTTRRTAMSLVYSREAWRFLAGSFPRVLRHPADVEARGAMQLGASLAGLAIENSMLGAAHALANPLTAHYGIVHGQAIALMLPHVIRFNGQEVSPWYRELVMLASDQVELPHVDSAPAALADFVARLARECGLATRLADLAIERGQLPSLAADAAQQWTGTFNPRKVTEADFLMLYTAAY